MTDVMERMRTEALGVSHILMIVFASVVGLSAIIHQTMKDL